MKIHAVVAVMFAGLMVAANGAAADKGDVLHEDISGTKMPHGEVVIPAVGSNDAKTGYLFRFADAKLGSLPAVEHETTVGNLLDRARKERSGDIFYSPKNGGTLVVISGKATNLGAKYLYELSPAKLDGPKDVVVAEGHTPGAVEGVKEGEVCLIETTDGQFAALRVLRKLDSAVWIAWIATTGPDPTPKFDMTRGMMVSLPATGMGALTTPSPIGPASPTPTTLTATPTTTPATAPADSTVATIVKSDPTLTAPHVAPLGPTPALAPFFNTYLAQRQAMIDMRLKLIKKEAKTDLDIAAKAQAIDELGQLGGPDTAAALIDEISFVNAGVKKYSPVTMHPAVGALRALGKTGSAAALKAIGTLNLDTPAGGGDGAFLKTPEYKVHLLTLVIKGVEGPDVTEFLLTREAKKSDEPHRKMYDLAQAYLKQSDE